MLTVILNWVGLQANVRKEMVMVCKPLRSYGVRADEAYKWRMMGEGQSFKNRQRERVIYPK